MGKLTRTQFVDDLKRALVHLYDTEYLRQTRLLSVFHLKNRFDASSVFRNILTESIETLKPDSGLKDQERAWRTYGSLYYPYVQRLSQKAVADQLGMSPRHLRREQRGALEILADSLCQEYGLFTPFCDDDVPVPIDAATYDPLNEFEWLKNAPIETSLDLYKHFPNIVEMVRSLAVTYQVEVSSDLQPELPNLVVHPVAFDQILLSLFSIAILTSPGGQVGLQVAMQDSEVMIKIEGKRAVDYAPDPKNDDIENKFAIAKRITHLSKGTIRFVEKPDLFFALLSLPYVNQIPVMGVDDNPDVLQIMQRYTQGSRYEMITTANPAQVFVLAKQFAPKAIILDVMIPEIDGWKMLGRISENPMTREIPVIICTVLPQEELAHSLGAVAFLKKPFNRHDFLALLDQLVEIKESEFH
ncbi:MAG: response regulator [Chloroflexota bacterium]